MELDPDHLRTWIGRTFASDDLVTPRTANALAAVLDDPVTLTAGDPAPLGIHWCLSPDIVPMQRLGEDGHPAGGGFLPPVPLPRRMWAGGSLEFMDELRVGDPVHRSSRIEDVAVKKGRTGLLCFVAVRHDYATVRGAALSERHDIVYRDGNGRTAIAPPEPRAPLADRTDVVAATPMLLMRYSAASLNGHRIHYDREYCIREEGYPGLVVHGPLQATLLLRMAARLRSAAPLRFSYRAAAPLFDGQSFRVHGSRCDSEDHLWVTDADGRVTMTAEATAA